MYDGVDVIGEQAIDPATGVNLGIVRRYVHGPGMDEPLVWYEGSSTTDRRWLLADERGSIVAVTNASGTVTNVNRYDAYGQPATTNAGRFQYTGQIWLEEAGVYHYKARAYHAGLGRFMQTDPIGLAGGMNLYRYAGNDPVNATDPSGLVICTGSRIQQSDCGGSPGFRCYGDCGSAGGPFGVPMPSNGPDGECYYAPACATQYFYGETSDPAEAKAWAEALERAGFSVSVRHMSGPPRTFGGEKFFAFTLTGSQSLSNLGLDIVADQVADGSNFIPVYGEVAPRTFIGGKACEVGYQACVLVSGQMLLNGELDYDVSRFRIKCRTRHIECDATSFVVHAGNWSYTGIVTYPRTGIIFMQTGMEDTFVPFPWVW